MRRPSRVPGRQANRLVGREVELRSRNRIAMGIALGIAESLRDPLLELLGDVVLEDLCLVVDAIPGHPQHLGEIGLQQPVVADHLERYTLAALGQQDAPVGLVTDQAHLVHALEHRGHRPG